MCRDGKLINLKADKHYEVEYESDREMCIFFIKQFEPELEGTYKCVVSTAEKEPVSTAVEVKVSPQQSKKIGMDYSMF